MEHHIFVSRIDVMTVIAPAAALQIDFDITSHRALILKLQNRIAKVRARFPIPKSRMQNAQTPSVGQPQFIPPESLVPPDGLKQTLWRLLAVFPECGQGTGRRTPVRVNA
jgi:hypothetical protein